jgi:O-succinylbenzoic acid--CoA ligase
MDSPHLIDWSSEDSLVLLNPRMPESERLRRERLVVPLRGHLWLATSGTTGVMKMAAVSKRAMLVSAAAVNRHLASDASDVWASVLPGYHVGGLGIDARAFLSGARVVRFAWNPERFASEPGVTLSALVPAQVSDLVSAGLRAPAAMRAIVIGGGAMTESLYRSARDLGWPVLPSYGMTECSSQVATARLGSPDLLLLDHVEARVEPDGRLALRSEALFTGYGLEDGFVDPKRDGWFVAEDRVELERGILRVLGRTADFVKIGGESVDLSRLDLVLADITAEAAVFTLPDERLGHVIALAVAEGDAESIKAQFNERVMPYERARRVVRVAAIPRTPLGKLIRSQLADGRS